MSHAIKQKYELAVTYHSANYRTVILHLTGIPTNCHPLLRKLHTCHTQLHGKTTNRSQSIKHEYQQTATLH